jgi:hypothetical protein
VNILASAIRAYRKYPRVRAAVKLAVALHHLATPATARGGCPVEGSCSGTGLAEAMESGMSALGPILGRINACGAGGRCRMSAPSLEGSWPRGDCGKVSAGDGGPGDYCTRITSAYLDPTRGPGFCDFSVLDCATPSGRACPGDWYGDGNHCSGVTHRPDGGRCGRDIAASLPHPMEDMGGC